MEIIKFYNREGVHIFNVCKDKFHKYHVVSHEMEIVFTGDMLHKAIDHINEIETYYSIRHSLTNGATDT